MMKRSELIKNLATYSPQEIRAIALDAITLTCVDGVLIWDARNGHLEDVGSSDGFVLTERWAVFNQSSAKLYPDQESALAELARIAAREGRRVNGWSVDLTADGCQESCAWVCHASEWRP
jgi:hypothetical protein